MNTRFMARFLSMICCVILVSDVSEIYKRTQCQQNPESEAHGGAHGDEKACWK